MQPEMLIFVFKCLVQQFFSTMKIREHKKAKLSCDNLYKKKYIWGGGSFTWTAIEGKWL